jgi:hypothetical protein
MLHCTVIAWCGGALTGAMQTFEAQGFFDNRTSRTLFPSLCVCEKSVIFYFKKLTI